jgi:hypothetical protein
MRKISDSKISNYGRNKRVFLNNPRYKSVGRVKTKPTFNQLIKETHNQLIDKWGPYLEVNDPTLYESMTGKKAKKPLLNLLNQRRKLKRLILLMMIYMLTKRSVKLNVRLNLKRSVKS